MQSKTVSAIYRNLEERSNFPEVTVEQLVRHGCPARHAFRLLGAEREPEKAQDILLREGAKSIRRTVRRYFRGAHRETFRPGNIRVLHGAVTADLFGTLAGVPVEVFPVPPDEYERTSPSYRVQAAAALHAWLLDPQTRESWIVLIDRNTQGWKSYRLRGDFGPLGEVLAREAAYLGGVRRGQLEPRGTARDSTCRRCPYQASCSVRQEGRDASDFSLEVEGFTTQLDPLLTTVLDDYLWGMNRDKRMPGRISPSHISTHPCDRAVAYGLMGKRERERVDPQLRRVFDAGHVFHDILQAALGDAYPDFEAEVRLQHPTLPISGAADGRRVSQRRLYEIKTISDAGAEKLTGAKKDHRQQAALYVGMDPSVDVVEYIYINKSTGELIAFEAEADRDQWHIAAERSEDVVKAVDAYGSGGGSLPPKLRGKDYTCKRCKFAWFCRPELIRAEDLER